MSTFSAGQTPVRRREVGLWVAAVIGAGLLVPGLGLLLGLILAFTRLRSEPPTARWVPAAVGGTLLILQLVGLCAGGGSYHVSPAKPVA